ncbi:outer membrane protein transport protein [Antarcticibacterium sp. 1MA-6-2]|uniref:outer membrane protein transport protein n=1 Tax=Antarcticibacterium sp. 1MA-6-2 TaxID=2908210 RepID=UPI001F45DCCC|nr:outer membrane protein transport protein [Antarcticibacterium sp. 1MA-6-2]UJH89837.1 outer membrane protein transport protein [Antarcticibacterium sp. 1MA-6-2]
MIKRFIVIVALLSTVLTAAQEGNSSPYSYYGIGLTKFRGTVENQSMGGLTVFSDSIHLNLRNPASYGKLKLTTYSVGGSLTSTNLKSEDNSGSARNVSFDYLAIGIPTGKLNFGFGLIPYTSVGYRILEESENASNRYTGRGGMNKVYLTTAYSFTPGLSVGVDLNYNFGNVQNKFTALQRGVQYGTRVINRTDLRGFNLDLGVDYQTNISNKLRLYTAATYTPEMDITTERMRNTATVVTNSQGGEAIAAESNLSFPETSVGLPSQYTMGLGVGRPNHWFVGGEYTNLQASNFDLDTGLNNLNYFYGDAAQYRLGGFYVPEYTSLTSYINRIVYRAGLRYEETGLNVNNEGINEFGISFGLGLPVGANFSNANIGFEYGQRGTTNSGLIKENFFKLSLSLSLNDRWFVQSRFD